jgi:hypothetical protein
MPVASRYFLASVSRVKFIEWNLGRRRHRVMEHVKLVQIRWLAIGEWQVTEPEIKLDLIYKLQVLQLCYIVSKGLILNCWH